jgi:hypothetical protein
MQRHPLRFAPLLLVLMLAGCAQEYQPPPETIPSIPPGRSNGEDPVGRGGPAGVNAPQN